MLITCVVILIVHENMDGYWKYDTLYCISHITLYYTVSLWCTVNFIKCENCVNWMICISTCYVLMVLRL